MSVTLSAKNAERVAPGVFQFLRIWLRMSDQCLMVEM
jgi:hypothetical protein